MRNITFAAAIAGVLFGFGQADPAAAQQRAARQGGQLTLCWAAWDPANALVELSRDFTQQTGINMRYEFVPWTSYADRFLNELNSHGRRCDLIIGDSQWLGGAAENGHYVQLNDFFQREGIRMEDFLPAAVEGYTTWPKGSRNYWALPAMGDALGWVYRRDWFARPDLRAEFRQRFNRDLAPPTTWTELREVAQFFQGREIDWFAFFPGLYRDERVGGERIGFFTNPRQRTEASVLGGQGISVVAYSENRENALRYIRWFAQPDVQRRWWSLGGYSCLRAVLEDPGFPRSAPFAADFLRAMSTVQDFWQEPTYAQLLLDMQRRVHDYVVAGNGTAREALDLLLRDWTRVFREEGRL